MIDTHALCVAFLLLVCFNKKQKDEVNLSCDKYFHDLVFGLSNLYERAYVNENGIKATGLHVHHAFLYISSPSLHDYDVKMHDFTFCGGREHKATAFFFFFLNFDTVF